MNLRTKTSSIRNYLYNNIAWVSLFKVAVLLTWHMVNIIFCSLLSWMAGCNKRMLAYAGKVLVDKSLIWSWKEVAVYKCIHVCNGYLLFTVSSEQGWSIRFDCRSHHQKHQLQNIQRNFRAGHCSAGGWKHSYTGMLINLTNLHIIGLNNNMDITTCSFILGDSFTNMYGLIQSGFKLFKKLKQTELEL